MPTALPQTLTSVQRISTTAVMPCVLIRKEVTTAHVTLAMTTVTPSPAQVCTFMIKRHPYDIRITIHSFLLRLSVPGSIIICVLSLPPLSSDIDECIKSEHNCSANANCTDTEGSYNCTCEPGYEGNGFTCTSMSYMQLIQFYPTQSDWEHNDFVSFHFLHFPQTLMSVLKVSITAVQMPTALTLKEATTVLVSLAMRATASPAQVCLICM